MGKKADKARDDLNKQTDTIQQNVETLRNDASTAINNVSKKTSEELRKQLAPYVDEQKLRLEQATTEKIGEMRTKTLPEVESKILGLDADVKRIKVDVGQLEGRLAALKGGPVDQFEQLLHRSLPIVIIDLIILSIVCALSGLGYVAIRWWRRRRSSVA